ncbi:uncharacterized protein LOC117593886 [Esox lucius]|uniref:uncharacterized protein LOC117593886 n=1 Tax=Esox lucius TaxID=8010 RepID=UPI001476FB67|nr:uncharacterized protein LOC117593886 [Esox lucius]
MDHTWPCVLLMLNTLIYCGHSQGIPAAVLTLQPNWPQIFMGESVTMICNIQEGDVTDWTYTWRRTFNNGYTDFTSTENKHQINATDLSVSGDYTCLGRNRHNQHYSMWSNRVRLTVTALPTASVSVSPHGLLYSGETVTLQCDISDYTDWTYWWYRNKQLLSPGSPSKTITTLSDQVSQYQCQGRRTDRPQSSQRSVSLPISVTDQPKAVLSFAPQWMNPGDSVTLNCEFKESSTGWRFSWYKTVPYRAGLPSLLDKSYSVEPLSGYGTTEESYTLSSAGPTDTGGYICSLQCLSE